MKRIILLVCGYLSLVLGVIGIFVPVLPTTPFLLLASACFLRSSHAMHQWLIQHRILGDYLFAYQRFKAVSAKAKVFALILLWVGIGFSVIYVIPIFWVKILLLIVAGGVSIYILCLATLTKEMRTILKSEKTHIGGGTYGV